MLPKNGALSNRPTRAGSGGALRAQESVVQSRVVASVVQRRVVAWLPENAANS